MRQLPENLRLDLAAGLRIGALRLEQLLLAEQHVDDGAGADLEAGLHDEGAVVPTPTFPEVNTADVVLSPATCNFAPGAVVPIPTFPVDPAMYKLNPASEIVVFAVNAPPSVTVFDVNVNPLLNDNGT